MRPSGHALRSAAAAALIGALCAMPASGAALCSQTCENAFAECERSLVGRFRNGMSIQDAYRQCREQIDKHGDADGEMCAPARQACGLPPAPCPAPSARPAAAPSPSLRLRRADTLTANHGTQAEGGGMRVRVCGHADDAGVQGRCRSEHVRRPVPRARQRELLVRPAAAPSLSQPSPRRPTPTPTATCWSSPPAHIADFALPRCSWFALGIGRMCEGDGECGTEEISNCPGRDAPDASPLEAVAPVGALKNSDVYRLVPCNTKPPPDQQRGRVILAPPLLSRG